MKDIFVIGDERAKTYDRDITFSEFSKFLGVKSMTYQEIQHSPFKIASGVPVLLCFPYELWDQMVEKKDELYGVAKFGNAIRIMTEYLTDILEAKFPYAQYVNHPRSIILERDKLEAKKVLQSNNINVVKNIDKSIESILNEVELGESVYIKVRYGSMGKGITYVSPYKWTTNFKYDGKIISNHANDKDWKEIDITGDTEFLKKMLSEDILVERAVKNELTNGFKFDMRGRALFGKAEPRFAYGRASKDHSITNISQGAKRISLQELASYIPFKSREEALSIIGESAKCLGLNYAGGDILFEGKTFKPVFLEINSFPGYHMAETLFPALYNEIRRNMLNENIMIHYERYNNLSPEQMGGRLT